MPPLAALYAEIPGTPNVEPPDDTFTIEPPPASMRCGIAYFEAQNTLPVSVARTIASHSSVASSCIGFIPALTRSVGAALLINVVSVPYRSIVAAIASCTLDSSLTSRRMNVASPPCSRIRDATFSPLSTERPDTTTFAPSAANISAVVRPIPRVEPLMNATLSCSLIRFSVSGSDVGIVEHVEVSLRHRQG